VSPRVFAGVSRLEFEREWSTKRSDGALGGFRIIWGSNGVIGLDIRASKGGMGTGVRELLE